MYHDYRAAFLQICISVCKPYFEDLDLMSNIQLTILMPCLDEAETLALCINKANTWAAQSGMQTEVLIADNGSTDGSQAIAESLGARVVPVKQRGYGSALFHGCMAAKGEWIIMGDSDDSYDFSKLDRFVLKLREGFDLVMGNRFLGGILPGAMPWKNRYIGNPILTWIGRLLFKCPAKDFHCGLRGFRKDAFLKMDLRTTGMEFASEMVIKANLFGMRIAEVPTTLSKDGRSRPPHLRPWRDGWRHLRFMFLFSPRWLFFIPGSALFLISLASYTALLSGPVKFGTVVFDVHTLLFAEAGIVLGFLAAILGVVIQMFGIREGLLREHVLLEKIRASPILEVGGVVGILMILVALYLGFDALMTWSAVKFGSLAPGALLRSISISTLLVLLGGITLMTSLIMGFLALPSREQR
jgi:glycosyltransferase involved in cell wall biosynthesis